MTLHVDKATLRGAVRVGNVTVWDRAGAEAARDSIAATRAAQLDRYLKPRGYSFRPVWQRRRRPW